MNTKPRSGEAASRFVRVPSPHCSLIVRISEVWVSGVLMTVPGSIQADTRIVGTRTPSRSNRNPYWPGTPRPSGPVAGGEASAVPLGGETWS